MQQTEIQQQAGANTDLVKHLEGLTKGHLKHITVYAPGDDRNPIGDKLHEISRKLRITRPPSVMVVADDNWEAFLSLPDYQKSKREDIFYKPEINALVLHQEAFDAAQMGDLSAQYHVIREYAKAKYKGSRVEQDADELNKRLDSCAADILGKEPILDALLAHWDLAMVSSKKMAYGRIWERYRGIKAKHGFGDESEPVDFFDDSYSLKSKIALAREIPDTLKFHSEYADAYTLELFSQLKNIAGHHDRTRGIV